MNFIELYDKIRKICSWVWQLPQNLLALVIRRYIKKKIEREYKIDGVKVIVTTAFRASMSLGKYIFILPYSNVETIAHELGHCRQSEILGFLYLIIIGLPSILHNIIYSACDSIGIKWNYYDFYTEWWLMY